jgi:hypothetical protein
MHHRQVVDGIHLANAEELAHIAEEIRAEVLRKSLRYPSDCSGWPLGDLYLGEQLARCRDQEVVLILAPVGRPPRWRRRGMSAASAALR